MNKEIEIPEGYEARIEGNKVILEPKESEDERIRKELIQYHTDGMKDSPWFTQTLRHKDVLAYLERQKEQPTDAKLERVVKAARRVLNNWLDGTDCPDVSGDFAELEYAIREYDGEEKQKEQMPAEWSEEDKVMLNNIIWSVHMKSIIKPLYEMDDRSRYKKYEDFLKALPERFNLQPNWKPSEEQMEALMLAIEGKWAEILPTGYMSRRLEDLYEGLANTFKVECKLEE